MNTNAKFRRMRPRMTALAAATVALVSVAGAASASDPVLKVDGSIKVNCTQGVKFKATNSGTDSTQVVPVVGRTALKPVTVPAGTTKVFWRHADNGTKVRLLGPADSVLARRTVPAQCADGSPRAYIRVTKGCKAVFRLDATLRSQDIAFLIQDGKGAFYRPVLAGNQRIVRREVHNAGQWIYVDVLRYRAFAVRVPMRCTP